jgi:c-di-GMP-related signal transduction protein|tara:strand:+ start:15 stop:461 length:447 start_codon:yes stop_codon:yes gene_type:complete
MIDLESILKEWREDCEISQHQLDEVSRQTPSLHAKYLQYLALAKLQLKRSENNQKTLLKQKFLYYNGKMSQEEVLASGWDLDPFNGLRMLKGEMDYYYDSDPEIQKSEEKIVYHKTLIETLSNIVDTLKWRHQTVKNMIDWRKFEAGG